MQRFSNTIAASEWNFRYFTKAEFDCKETGENKMQRHFMLLLDQFRHEWRRPLKVTSGYRSPLHSIEARKTHSNGEHTTGLCADIAVSAADRYEFVSLAITLGFIRIGIAETFIHLGISQELPNPRIWTY